MATGAILIIEDNVNLRDLIEHQIARIDGHDVTWAADGESGLETARIHNPDLILLDWMLPGIDGLQVLIELKRSPATQHIPVYMLTTKGKMANVEKALAEGAEDYLTKPIDLAELSRKVKIALEAKEAAP